MKFLKKLILFFNFINIFSMEKKEEVKIKLFNLYQFDASFLNQEIIEIKNFCSYLKNKLNKNTYFFSGEQIIVKNENSFFKKSKETKNFFDKLFIESSNYSIEDFSLEFIFEKEKFSDKFQLSIIEINFSEQKKINYFNKNDKENKEKFFLNFINIQKIISTEIYNFFLKNNLSKGNLEILKK